MDDKDIVEDMHNKDTVEDKEVVRQTAVYATEALTEPEHDESQTTAHNLINEQAKESYYFQESPIAGLPRFMYNYDRNRSIFDMNPAHSWSSSKSPFYINSGTSSIGLVLTSFCGTSG